MPAQHVPFCTVCTGITNTLDAPFLLLSDQNIPATDWRPPPAAVVCPLAATPADDTGPGIHQASLPDSHITGLEAHDALV